MASTRNTDNTQKVKPAHRNVTSTELPTTFPDKFIEMLDEADLIVSVSGRKVLHQILREIPPVPLTLTVQDLVLERLEELPTNAPREDTQNEEEQYRELRYTADELFQQLAKAQSFKYAAEVAAKQSPQLPGESDLYEIIFELVRAGLLLNSPAENPISDFPIWSGPLYPADIENAHFGVNGQRGKISLDTGIITRIIEHPLEQFSPFLRKLLQHNDATTLEGNIYEYVWSRRTLISDRTPAQARAALLEKGVRVTPTSAMNMEKATTKCHELHTAKGPCKQLHNTDLDLHLTVQAHLLGRGFVTNNKRFLMEWSSTFENHGICAYALDGATMFEGMDV